MESVGSSVWKRILKNEWYQEGGVGNLEGRRQRQAEQNREQRVCIKFPGRKKEKLRTVELKKT